MFSTLLYILKKKKDFFRYKPYIKDTAITPEIKTIISAIESYWKVYPKLEELEFDPFITWFKFTKLSTYSKDKHSLYNKVFSQLLDSPPSEDDIKRTLEFFIDMDYAIRMADHLIKVSEGDDSKSVLDIEVMLNEYKKDVDRATSDSIFSEDDFDSILDNHLRPGLEWRLEELNISVGPLRKGDFVIITSRPDSGKTTALCSEATFMAKQLADDEDVIWFNNEETRQKVKQRIWQAALGLTKEEMAKDKLLTKSLLEKELLRLDRIKLVDIKAMTVHDVEKALESSNPGLIIFDQLWKISGFSDAFSEVDKMTRLFSWARGLADKYAPVINVHQADGTAAGQAYIQMNQLYNSKTGIQGEADAIIGIGREFDGHINDRHIFVSKNKLDGGPRSDPLQRNGKFGVVIHPHIARFTGSFKRPS